VGNDVDEGNDQSIHETLDRSTNKDDTRILVGLAQSNSFNSDTATDGANWSGCGVESYIPTQVSAV
jgi:hypothetical protein